MPRADLLSLSPDDLATLANRGLVKRAQSELDGGQLTYTLSENAAGTVSILWSDDVHCLLPSGAPLQSGKCSCSATGLCRHLIRSVMAYQREHPAPVEEPPTSPSGDAAEIEVVAVAPAVDTTWNPGEITDEELARHIPSATLKRAHKNWDFGHVIEVSLGNRPSARFHTLGVNLRFLVPHDVRYTHCDCAEHAPCLHVPLAVWAFRQLASDARNALISTRREPLPIPRALLDAIESALIELTGIGVGGVGRSFLDKLQRLERECRAQELIWPADIIAELSRQIEFHGAHNARFEPLRVAQLVGELLIRSDAIGQQTGAVPDVFVRGSASDTTTAVGAARLIGLGTQARPYRGGVEFFAFFQDFDSGAVVFVSHDFPDPRNQVAPNSTPAPVQAAPSPPQSFWRLASSPVIKGIGIGTLGSGQVLARGGKRAPNGEFSFGRTPLSFNFQNFEWEKLRAPLLYDNFAELDAHLSQAAPPSLRPRRAGENLHVIPLAGVEKARFAGAEQEVRAILRDTNGGQALLVHPYFKRGAEGVDALLTTLACPDAVRFVAGMVQRTGEGLVISPLALISQEGSTRSIVQPWTSPKPPVPSSTLTPPVKSERTSSGESTNDEPLHDYVMQICEALGEMLLMGLQRTDEKVMHHWKRLQERGANLGFSRLLHPIAILVEELERKTRVRYWEGEQASPVVLELSVLVLFIQETG